MQITSNATSYGVTRLVDRLSATYRCGKQKPSQCSLAAGRMLDQASAYIKPRLTDYEQAVAAKCYAAGKRSRTLSAGPDAVSSMGEACQQLAVAYALAHSSRISEEARLLCLAEVYPAEAFVEHQYGNPRKACQLVEKSLAADQELEDRFGHHTKIAHRLYSVTLSAAILFQQNKSLEASRTLACLLRLLAGKSQTLAVSGDWSQTRIARLPEGMREFHAMQAIGVLCSFMAALDLGARRQMVQAFIDEMRFEPTTETPSSSEKLKWNGADIHGSSIPQDFMVLLEGSLAVAPEALLRYVSDSVQVLQRGVSMGLMLAVTLDAVKCLLESGYDAQDASPLLEEIRFDLQQFVVSRVVRMHQRACITRLSGIKSRPKFTRQPQAGCLAFVG